MERSLTLSLLALWLGSLTGCPNTNRPFGDCADDPVCTRVSVCLCGGSTCDEICDLGAARRECYRYGSGGTRVSVAVTADDCSACRGVESGFDPGVDCRAEITCPSGCSEPNCCATAADCTDGRGCLDGCCRTFVGPPPDAGGADSGRPAGCPESCATSDCCRSTAECSDGEECIMMGGAEVGCCFVGIGPPPFDIGVGPADAGSR